MTTTTDTLEARAKFMLTDRTVGSLIDMFEITDMQLTAARSRKDYDQAEYICTVRGWVMDELNERDATAFDAWVDSLADSPRNFFGCNFCQCGHTADEHLLDMPGKVCSNRRCPCLNYNA